MTDEVSAAADARLNRLLNLILETAVEVTGFDAATLSARHERGYSTIGSTDPRVVEIDEAQYATGRGPCVAVLEPMEPTFVQDTSADGDRWEHFLRTAQQVGVVSSLSLHVPTEAASFAASLNLYSRQRVELSDAQVRAGIAYATQLAAAMESVQAYRVTATLAREMADAMRSRAAIEQAKGMLMADRRLSASEAFEELCRIADEAEVDVRTAALRLVEERSRR
jgi:hypothetical protein